MNVSPALSARADDQRRNGSLGEFLGNSANRLVNVGLRGATLGTRFLFIFFLAKYLDPASVGYYGLFTATVGYCLYFVGLDFYTYVTREVLKTPNEQRGRLLKGQAALSGVLYALLFPVAALFLQRAGWPDRLAYWFLPILLLEHFNQEVFRLLIALSEQVTASMILFIRQGSWALAIVGLMAWDASARHLHVVMALWVTAGVAAAALGAWKVRVLRMGGWQGAIDWAWIRRGIGVSAVFLIATLALRATQSIDRFWIRDLGGIEIVGAYVLLLGVAGTLMVFLDAGLFAYAYPALIKLHHNEERGPARAKVRQMVIQVLAFSAAFGAVSWVVLPHLLDWINKPVYRQSIGLYPWLLLATVVNALGMVPHFALYARGCDKPIVYSHMAGLIAFVLATWALSGRFSALAVPLGLNFSFAAILVWKTTAYQRLIRADAVPKTPPQIANA